PMNMNNGLLSGTDPMNMNMNNGLLSGTDPMNMNNGLLSDGNNPLLSDSYQKQNSLGIGNNLSSGQQNPMNANNNLFSEGQNALNSDDNFQLKSPISMDDNLLSGAQNPLNLNNSLLGNFLKTEMRGNVRNENAPLYSITPGGMSSGSTPLMNFGNTSVRQNKPSTVLNIQMDSSSSNALGSN
ncbi:MAG: hypothetical protein MJ252_29510, partial [archaeon]|nr:hypothetical protein [archaeon]